MESKYELKTMNQQMAQDSTADDYSTMVRSILRLPFHVSEIAVKPGVVTWSAHIPKSEPPDGEVMDPTPGDVTELLSKIELIEISGTKTGLNLKSFAVISQMLLIASKKSPGDGVVGGMKGAAWVVGNKESFCLWLGVRPDNPPTRFLNMPLIELDDLPKDRLLLLCSRSEYSDHLESEAGVIVAMVRKDKK